MKEENLDNALKMAEEGLGKSKSPFETEKSRLQEDRDKLINSKIDLSANVYSRTPAGYINIVLSDLPSKGYFYPAGTLIQIRGASSQSIEHYSIMNDQDPLDVRSHIMDLLIDNTRFVLDGRPLDVSDLADGDKVYLLLSIYEFTFPNKENEITLTSMCPHCNKEHEYTLSKNILTFITDIKESFIEKYNEERRCFTFETKSLGMFNFVAPKMGVTYKLFDLYRTSKKVNNIVSDSFLTILPYIFDIRTTEVTENNILKLYDTYLEENSSLTNLQQIQKYSLIYKIIDSIKIGLDPNVTVNCLGEGMHDKQFTFPFELHDGWKSLFIISNILDEIL
jgi:hypothetical protein